VTYTELEKQMETLNEQIDKLQREYFPLLDLHSAFKTFRLSTIGYQECSTDQLEHLFRQFLTEKEKWLAASKKVVTATLATDEDNK
jgi:hypothetical protein